MTFGYCQLRCAKAHYLERKKSVFNAMTELSFWLSALSHVDETNLALYIHNNNVASFNFCDSKKVHTPLCSWRGNGASAILM